MAKRFVNSFEVIEMTVREDEHWVTLRDLRGDGVTLRIPEYTATDLHVGGIVGLYIEV
ncbi:MAG: hypothetical protein ACE5QF_04660 [Thermoplasmata archaeon]